MYDRTFTISGGFQLDVKITASGDGTQEAVLSTNAPGRLLLHWGVEGGKGYKGGWRLPGDSSRPEDTIEYKKRALQTPFKPAVDSIQEIRLKFSGDEASDHLNFVLKDTSSDKWYDLNGANFQVPLRQSEHQNGGSTTSISAPLSSNGNGNGVASVQGQIQENLLPLDQIPAIPQDLSGVWAYMKWEAAGYPARSKEEADTEYEASLRELALLLRRRVSIEELQAVANEGVNKYKSFTQEVENKWSAANKGPPQQAKQQQEEQKNGSQNTAPSPPPSSLSPNADIAASLPEGLVNLKAYLMWEAAGKPDGADFGVKARDSLAAEVAQGKSLEKIEEEMRGPQPQTQQKQKQQEAPQAVKEQPAAAAAAPPPPAVQEQPPRQQIIVGESIHMRQRTPLDLIHRSAAPRLVEKAKKRETPLQPLLATAQEDETVVWHRVS